MGPTGYAVVFKHGPDVLRLVLAVGFMELPWTMAQLFMPLYARDFKGADEFVLGGISTAAALVPMLISIPVGRLADRYGRKKLLFAVAPFHFLANLCLVLAPAKGMTGTLFLLLHGLLFGFNSISMGLASSMTAEIVPKDQMGTLDRHRQSISRPAGHPGSTHRRAVLGAHRSAVRLLCGYRRRCVLALAVAGLGSRDAASGSGC